MDCSSLYGFPRVTGLRKSRSTEALTDAITELSLAKEPLKDVKSMVPITFQDLVNSVQPTPLVILLLVLWIANYTLHYTYNVHF